jgi:simple sugar transport system substrate-binding protein
MYKKLMGSLLALGLTIPALGQIDSLEKQGWCEGVSIRFFAGGSEGDAFAGIVHRGALAAQRDLGADVQYVFSGWDSETMIQQLREAVAQAPTGIAMMGHPGGDAIMPLAADAAAAGIIMMYQNVDVPDVRAAYGGGYVGAQLGPQGVALGEEAIRQFGFTTGDKAIVIVNLTQRERAQRELGVWEALEGAGVEIIHIQPPSGADWGADPNLAIPSITAAIADNPEVKLIVMPGGQMLGNTQTFFETAGVTPGQIKSIGFDTNELIMKGFADGWIQLTSDQQPFLQGYLPVLSICQTAKLGLAPMSVDTGAGFIDITNYQQVQDLANAGYR